ncbi:MAG: SDR family oxidoreductase [Nanoarchaeota archaeon]|nr:SDR family oxidoreductase [Nanoarchaeota archaeon]
MLLKNKIAIVTGSRMGIGLSIAEEFAKDGANLVIADLDLKDCQKVATQLKKKYKIKTLAVKCDVSKKNQVDDMVKIAAKQFKRIDILVNNAGIYPFTDFTKLTETEWDKVLDINLKSILLVSQAAVKHMKPGSNIINLSSIAGFIAFPGLVHYCASKSGMIGMTKVMALELGKKKIRVNAIAPGIIETPGTKGINKKAMLANVPLGRTGKPLDIAKAALFLASDMADYITGHTLVVDGGWITH